MSFLSNIFGFGADPRDSVRPLWHRVVEAAREPAFYAELGVADTMPGRFDMVTAMLALVLLRLESEPELVRSSVWLTELFVEDMDGQLREAGVGDQVVGKHMGRQMAVLGGRLGALREALTQESDTGLTDYIARNITLADEAPVPRLAAALRGFAQRLAAQNSTAILAGEIAR